MKVIRKGNAMYGDAIRSHQFKNIFFNGSHKTKYNLKVDLRVDYVGSQVMKEPEINYGMN